MGAALALGARGRGRTAPNPCVGCVIVAGNVVVGRGWTQPGGRPHAEAVALAEAGAAARGATAYVTLEPCAAPGRGPACAALLIEAGIARVVVAADDPFPAVNGQGYARLRAAGIAVETGVRAGEAERAMAGFLTRQWLGRPLVTLKLATSLDGQIALGTGESRWITGPEARAHTHLERSRHEAILVGRGTYDADAPQLDVRMAGLEERRPRRLMLTRQAPPPGWEAVASPAAIAALDRVDHLLVEGGAGAAAAFVAAGLVDRLILYRAPILIGAGRAALGDIGLGRLAEAHGRWRLIDARALGSDRLEVYEALEQAPGE
ncbi:bifunctional diaminohydroxyphosphoribosylaminopyrimidine deaminase/5-amino-6-(5-phosphoribosylamino)uracil reductase RibD [Sphingomonas sp.]|uniref:bifunctional diaminohydroxyphosphoribosylaminopyrimidine deaminase/5-amino-6-(5-phosphoribosylamino)uracil reductase RibD n=1 Tax=Sphingomonas sp. TaxID=28214 RepID=UPI001D9310DE|nr:bifunctional diaminohydroxyphosphoribosylaminopyrimidine deaminase/5-amino-6-(5-phosphoribosylamino)uracil reductase RibD [Sphingomonas sp.]MBX9795399.1 bifunctional diaminohydroxyphosphoribosylaminopyrimidine deaminase/5-amino-6-(5-phosphoribosylamino)uracil reductase RibD [Sphingomonas sp.]